MGILFKGGEEQIVEKYEAVVTVVLELDQGLENYFVELQIENIEQLPMARLETPWIRNNSS